jgi:hypothetical protein
MSNQEIKYTISANTAGFESGMRQVRASLQGMRDQFSEVGKGFGNLSQSMKAQLGEISKNISSSVSSSAGAFSSLTDAIGGTRLGMTAFLGVAAAVAASKLASSSAAMTESVMDLGRGMGVTTNEAQKWKLAAEDVGATQGDVEAAAKGLTRQLKENEEDLNKLGLRTRDLNGNLRPMNELLSDGITVVNGYKEGTDRAQAAQAIFGRGVDGSSRVLMVNKELLSEMDAEASKLGLTVGADAVQNFKEFDTAVDGGGRAMRGLGNTIGQILMPVITDLVNVFRDIMPAAITVVRGALGGLVSAFHLVKNGVVTVWEVINAMVVTVAEPIRALAEAIGRAITGDFKGAADAIRGIGTNIGNAWENAMNKMAESSQKTRDRIAAIFMDDTLAGNAGGAMGDKGFNAPGGKKEAAPRAVKEVKGMSDKELERQQMAGFEEMLALERRAAVQKDALRDYTKEQELAFWRERLNTEMMMGNNKLIISKKVADLEVAVWKEQAKQQQGLRLEDARARQEGALSAVDAARQEAQAQLDLGMITQQQMLEMERGFEEQKLEIRRAYLQARLAEIDPERDPVAYAQISNQIEELERQHRLRLRQIQIEIQKNSPAENVWQGMRNSFEGALTGMLSGQQKFSQAMKNLWQGIRQSIAAEIAKIITAKVAAFMRERVLGVAEVGLNAVKAGSGAAASQANIPIVGPAMALAAMASVMGAVLGLTGSIPSAAKGWSIPAGVNPITQLHEQEMVLPAAESNVIRSLAERGGAGAGGNVTVELRGASAGEFFISNKRELAEALRVAMREGHGLRRS